MRSSSTACRSIARVSMPPSATAPATRITADAIRNTRSSVTERVTLSRRPREHPLRSLSAPIAALDTRVTRIRIPSKVGCGPRGPGCRLPRDLGLGPDRAESRPAVLIRRGGDRLLIDCAEGTQRQLLRSDVGLAELREVFITHYHADHYLGLPGMLKTFALRGRELPLTCTGRPACAS